MKTYEIYFNRGERRKGGREEGRKGGREEGREGGREGYTGFLSFQTSTTSKNTVQHTM